MDCKEWIERGIKENYKIILIIYDLEDKSYYPVYFYNEGDSLKFSRNIISESKIKIVKSINL